MKLEAETVQSLQRMQEEVRQNLTDSVLPFWTQNAWDKEYGGFLTRLDRKGHRLPQEEKYLMMQVRMLASLSWAYTFGPKNETLLTMADETFEFINQKMWDLSEGGFSFSVTRQGRVISDRKNTDTHAYAITGLAAYSTLPMREDFLETANSVFLLLEEKASDSNLGYREDFDGKFWEPLNADQMHIEGQQEIKTIDMHTNMLEAYAYLYEASGDPRHAEAMQRLAYLIVRKGLDSENGCTITAFTEDWRPLRNSSGHMITSYGLNVELAWLLVMANSLLSKPSPDLHKAAIKLIDHAIAFGFDNVRGGLAAYGPHDAPTSAAQNLPLDRETRLWWTQAELMNALVTAAEITDDQKYVHLLLTQWEWIKNYQVDHEYGDWYQEVDPGTGKPLFTDKGREFKTSFHTSRALIRTFAGIERLVG